MHRRGVLHGSVMRRRLFGPGRLAGRRHAAGQPPAWTPAQSPAAEDFVTLEPSLAEGACEAGSSALAPEGEVLGKRVTPPLRDDEVRSRLGLRVPRATPFRRDGARTAAEETLAAAAEAAEDPDKGTDGDSNDEPLPYDDPELAERILAMEVEGQLDEMWQEGPRARVEDCAEIVGLLRELKARDLVCIDTRSKTTSFDFILFATCEGPRHLHLCSWSITSADRARRTSKPRRQRGDQGWDIVPVGRILVNLFLEPVRHDLSLERKWAVAQSMDPLTRAGSPISEGRVAKAHGLYTLSLNLQDLEDFEIDYCRDALMAQL